MVLSTISGLRLAGIASAVPAHVRTIVDDGLAFGVEETRRISQVTGVRQRHVATDGICTSDLCFAAAERLLCDLNWSRESVDAILFVSQTPDYLLPATSCCLHGRLGLAKRCAALDINLGCSGYIYGLWLAGHLIGGGSAHRVLLMAGDTISRISGPGDRSVTPLFGDAGTATALERNSEEAPFVFDVGSDGTGQDHLIVPAGLFREPRTEVSRRRTRRENGNVRSDEDLYMNGAEVFAFTQREVPPLLSSILAQTGWDPRDISAFVLHQANSFLLHHLSKKLRLPREKVLLTLSEYGNTSSASIPLTITHHLSAALKIGSLQLVLIGFGVGFSWGAAAMTCGPMVMPPLVLVSAENALPKERSGC